MVNGTLLIVSTDLPKANEKTAKKSKELTAGPMIVWVPTLVNRKTSFLNNEIDQNVVKMRLTRKLFCQSSWHVAFKPQ